jgi:hypothetical protein
MCDRTQSASIPLTGNGRFALSTERGAQVRNFVVASAISLGILAPTTNVELLSQSGSATAQSIEGVWKGVSVVVTGANAYTIPNRLPMMIIYTKRHYSVLAQDSDGRQLPRQAPPPSRHPANRPMRRKLPSTNTGRRWSPTQAPTN